MSFLLAPFTGGFSAAFGVVLGLSLLTPKMSGVATMAIALTEARGIVTNTIVAVYNEQTMVSSFLRSFFPNVFKPTKLVSVAVKRGTEKIAVDRLRGTGSNLNSKPRSSISTILPPLYSESHNMNELDVYDIAYSTLDPQNMAVLAQESAELMVEDINKIERSYEKQCADVLMSGIITLENGDNIDFGRLPASLVDGGAGTYWTVATVDPMVALEARAKFIREVGKAQGGVYNVIMGGKALNAMLNNPIFQAKYDLKNVTLGEIREPQRMSNGGTLHGRITGGSYSFNVWTYPEGYENAAGVFVKYIADEYIVVLPEVTNFITANGLVPQLPGMTGQTNVNGGSYVRFEYLDPKQKNHVQEVSSAGVAIPVAIDTIATQKVTA